MVDEFNQQVGGSKCDPFTRRNDQSITGLWIPSHPGLPRLDSKAAEPGDEHSFPISKGTGNGGEKAVHDLIRLTTGNSPMAAIRGLGEIGFLHRNLHSPILAGGSTSDLKYRMR